MESVLQLLALTRRLCLSESVGQLKANTWMHGEMYKKVPFDVFNGLLGIQKKSMRRLSQSMLYQIPSLGIVAVESINKAFPTIAQLMQALAQCSSAPAESVRRQEQVAFLASAAKISLEKAAKLRDIFMKEF